MRAASFAARVVLGLACLALASSCPATLVAQVPPAWGGANANERCGLINANARRMDESSRRQFVSLIQEAGDDESAQVRMTAMAAVSGRFGGHRFRGTPDMVSRRETAAVVEDAIRPIVRRLVVEDADARVRREAVRALVNMDGRVGDPLNGIRLSSETVATLVSLTALEPRR